MKTVYEVETGKIILVQRAPRKVHHKLVEKYPPPKYGILNGRPADYNHKVVDGEFVKDADKELEAAWQAFRDQRDNLLKATDFKVIEDVPGDKAAWKAYRQKLRDLPSTVTDPTNVTWPTPPE